MFRGGVVKKKKSILWAFCVLHVHWSHKYKSSKVTNSEGLELRLEA